MIRFDSDSFIREMEEVNGVEENKFDYNFDIEEYEQITERDLKNDI